MIRVIAIGLVVTSLLISCSGSSAGSDGGYIYKGWGAPELVSASTSGWEEGVYISPDGNTLYYIYTNVDIFRLGNTGEEVVSGPNLDPAGSGISWTDGSSRMCGVYPYADHFFVTRTGDNTWSDPQPHFLTTTRMESIGGIHLIENSTRKMAYVMSGFGDGIDSIFYAYDDGKDGWESFQVDVGFLFDAYLFEVNLDPSENQSDNKNPSDYEDADRLGRGPFAHGKRRELGNPGAGHLQRSRRRRAVHYRRWGVSLL